MKTSTPIVTSDDLAYAIDSLSSIPSSKVFSLPQSSALGWLISFIHKHVPYFGRDMDAELIFNSNIYKLDGSCIIAALQTLDSEGLVVLGENKITPRTKFFAIYPRSEFGPKDN
jgi:hypothetical protein